MDMKWKSSVQRVTALVLCMAMLLTMAPMAVRAEESSSGFTEITDELFNAVGQADVLTMAEGIALPAYSTA